MIWKDTPVLVTGAGGFIGSHLVERLVAEGARVRALVHYNSRNDTGLLTLLPADTLEFVEAVPGDLRDPVAVNQAVEGMEVVFHLGALISIPYSYNHPFHVVETNLMGTLNVLQSCREAGVKRLVHTSSSEVYGTALHVPIDEDHPLQGQSPYSARLAQTNWPRATSVPMSSPSSRCALSIPMVHGNRTAPSSRPS